MNEKITFPRLAGLLADKSGRSKRFSEDFLREFFALISERLEDGDSVKVKGLGTFKLSRVEPRRSVDVTTGQPMEISGHSKVVFIPSKELAEAVNAPFEAFTAIEISDDADLSQLFSKEEIQLQESYDEAEDMEDSKIPSSFSMQTIDMPETRDEEIQTEEPAITQESPEGGKPVEIEEMPEVESAETQEEAEEELDNHSDSEPDETEEEAEGKPEEETGETEVERGEIPEEIEDEYEEEPSRKRTWVRTLMISLGAALFALIATFAIWYVFATNDFNRMFNRTAEVSTIKPSEGFTVGKANTSIQVADTVAEEDTVSEDIQTAVEEPEVPTAPSDAIVYDTISTTRYLTTMAKAHYGNYNLWPYIYEENKAILGHPDRIKPGTPVVIPKLSKYGVDPTNSIDVEKAKKMGIEIYARYGKKI